MQQFTHSWCIRWSHPTDYTHRPYAVKVAFVAGAIAVVVCLGCTIATSVGAGNILEKSKDIVARDKQSISKDIVDLKLQGDKNTGDLQVIGCPKSCRLVKGAVGNYLEAFAGFASVNLGLLVVQLILNAAAMMCTCSKIIAHSYDTRTHVN